jgi:DDE superfamily endonuclease
MDNYGTHKHAKVKAWLKRNPRFVSHFVPTSSSWMNLVERWFGHLDNKAIRRGVFLSVADLEASIEALLTAWNQDPKPFVWTATVESIQEKLTRCRRTLEQIKPGCTSPKSRKQKKSCRLRCRCSSLQPTQASRACVLPGRRCPEQTSQFTVPGFLPSKPATSDGLMASKTVQRWPVGLY